MKLRSLNLLVYSVALLLLSTPILQAQTWTISGYTNSKGRQIIKWKFSSNAPVVDSTVYVEHSVDAGNFFVVGSAPMDADSFSYSPRVQKNFYRLKVYGINGVEYSSDIFFMQNSGYSFPVEIQSARVSTTLTVTSEPGCSYRLFDLNGRLLGAGQLQPGVTTIPVNYLPKGMLVITFSNGVSIWSNKLLKY